MTGPTFVFAVVVATLIGALFHFIVGGRGRRLALFILAGWVGFALGHIAGQSLQIAIFPVGNLRLIPAIIGALFTLMAALIFTSSRRRTSR